MHCLTPFWSTWLIYLIAFDVNLKHTKKMINKQNFNLFLRPFFVRYCYLLFFFSFKILSPSPSPLFLFDQTLWRHRNLTAIMVITLSSQFLLLPSPFFQYFWRLLSCPFLVSPQIFGLNLHLARAKPLSSAAQEQHGERWWKWDERACYQYAANFAAGFGGGFRKLVFCLILWDRVLLKSRKKNLPKHN